jgi:hypothetical protein
MVKTYEEYNAVWSKKAVFKLDPELIEKEVKSMNSKALKLTNRFSAITSTKRDDKSKKGQVLQGPLKMLDWLSNSVK